eukprot:Gb_22745 [translate_table: standard]
MASFPLLLGKSSHYGPLERVGGWLQTREGKQASMEEPNKVGVCATCQLVARALVELLKTKLGLRGPLVAEARRGWEGGGERRSDPSFGFWLEDKSELAVPLSLAALGAKQDKTLRTIVNICDSSRGTFELSLVFVTAASLSVSWHGDIPIVFLRPVQHSVAAYYLCSTRLPAQFWLYGTCRIDAIYVI